VTRCALRVLEDKLLDPRGKLIALILVGLHDPGTHQTTISAQRLADLYGVRRQQIFVHLKRLVRDGSIIRTKHFKAPRLAGKSSYLVPTCTPKLLQ